MTDRDLAATSGLPKTRLGATPLGAGQTQFRVWAPASTKVEVALETGGRTKYLPLAREAGGYFAAVLEARVGSHYRYRLDGKNCFPDPASSFQPEGPHGPSQVVDPGFGWTDEAWRGIPLERAVFYELHVGTFTREGTYRALAREFGYLRDLGVTVLELMPLHTCPGRFNWGYDGVGLFAPSPSYGRPEDLQALVNEAHGLGLAVVLDVVYNHFGPDGNYLPQFSSTYFSRRHQGEWGDPLNFDDEGCDGPRELVRQNAARWIAEYHFDGLRLDAVQALADESEPHIVAELTRAARAAAGPRTLLVVGEHERQDVRAITPQANGGFGLDAIWIEDFHHASRVALTGHADAYTSDYRGTASEILNNVLFNALYQGQVSTWQQAPRGTPVWQVPHERAMFFLQNHDQVANSGQGKRVHELSAAASLRALTTLLLLSPQTPMLFMGQEWAAGTPFDFFVDHDPELQGKVQTGREGFLRQFPTLRAAIDDDGVGLEIGEKAFERSRLRLEERSRAPHSAWWAFHRELLRLRRELHPFVARAGSVLHGSALSEHALVLRMLSETPSEGDYLLLVNLGADLQLWPCPEPLLAAPAGMRWHPLFSSEATRFGGHGALSPTGEGPWVLPGRCGLLLSTLKPPMVRTP